MLGAIDAAAAREQWRAVVPKEWDVAAGALCAAAAHVIKLV